MTRVPAGDITMQLSAVVGVPRVQTGLDYVRDAANGRSLMSVLSDGSIAGANRASAARTNTADAYIFSTPPEKVEIDEHTGNTKPVVGTGGDDEESHTIEQVTGADPETRGGEERATAIETGGLPESGGSGGSGGYVPSTGSTLGTSGSGSSSTKYGGYVPSTGSTLKTTSTRTYLRGGT